MHKALQLSRNIGADGVFFEKWVYLFFYLFVLYMLTYKMANLYSKGK